MSDEEVLDDFFAKKDKTKKPKKKKKTKTETPVTQSESQVAQTDEWKDFEEQKEKDFSNLKIVDLQIGEEGEKEEQEVEVNDEDNVDGDDSESKHSGGIWKVTNTPSQSSPSVPQETTEPVGTHNVVKGKYVPPSVKRATMAAASQPVRRNRGTPPDIKSRSAFPTLSAASQDTNDPSDFEMVKKGTKTNDSRRDETGQRLEIGNRYDSLRS